MKEIQETIEPEYEERKTEYKKIIDDYKIKIELNNDRILFEVIKGLSYYKYKKEYDYEEIITELDIKEDSNINKVYENIIESECKIIDEGKKIKLNNKEIKLIEKRLKDEEIIEILIGEIKEIKEKNNNQCERINTLIKENIEKDIKISKLENDYNGLKGLVYEIDDNQKDKYKDEINIMYETKE